MISASFPGNSFLAVLGSLYLMLFYVGRVHLVLPLLRGIPLGIVSPLVAVALFMSHRERVLEVYRTAPFKHLLLFWAIGFLTVPVSAWPSNTFWIMVKELTGSVLFCLALSTSMMSEREFSRTVRFLMLSIGIVVIVAINTSNVSVRGVGEYYDPNDLAFIIVVSFAILFPFMRSRRGMERILLLVLIGVMFLAIIKSLSRGGMVAMAGVTCVIAAGQLKKSFFKALLFLLLISASFLVLTDEAFWKEARTLTKLGDDYNVTSADGRLGIWRRGFTLLAENPLIGAGVGNSASAVFKRFQSETRVWFTSHNSFLEVGVDLGLPGLALFIAILLTVYRGSLKAGRKFQQDGRQMLFWMPESIRYGIVAYILGSMFTSQGYSAMFFLLIALHVGVQKIAWPYGMNRDAA